MTSRANRRSRSLVLWALFLALVLVAAACGSDDDDSGSDDTETSETDSGESGDDTEGGDDDADEGEDDAEGGEDDADEGDDAASGETVDATIGIVNLAPVSALLLVEEGFLEGLESCPALNATIDSRNAEGDGSALGPIIAEFLDSEVDLILSIATPTTQATVTAVEADGRGTPVLFGAVTDPFAAGIATGPDDKPDFVTGWQAEAPVVDMFDIAAEINPDIATIGVAYDPSQVNSEAALASMTEEAEARGIAVETATIGDSSEVGTASQSLASRGVDFFFVPTDTILVNGLSGMATVADDNDIPIIAQDSNIPSAGAAIGTGLDYRGDGVRNADYACQILTEGATPADFPIQQFDEELVGYNTANAEAQGFEIPQSVLDRGSEVG